MGSSSYLVCGLERGWYRTAIDEELVTENNIRRDETRWKGPDDCEGYRCDGIESAIAVQRPFGSEDSQRLGPDREKSLFGE